MGNVIRGEFGKTVNKLNREVEHIGEVDYTLLNDFKTKFNMKELNNMKSSVDQILTYAKSLAKLKKDKSELETVYLCNAKYVLLYEKVLHHCQINLSEMEEATIHYQVSTLKQNNSIILKKMREYDSAIKVVSDRIVTA